YTNTVQVTPYRGAGRPQGVFCMERTMDKIARYLGKDRTEVRAANFIQPDEFPYDQRMTFQDGRPLIYDSGDYPEMLRMVKELIGWDDFEPAPNRGIGIGCYVEGTGVGPYEGGHVQITSDGRVHVSTGLTSRARATRPCSPRSPPPNWAFPSSESPSSPATPAGSGTRSAPSPPGPRS